MIYTDPSGHAQMTFEEWQAYLAMGEYINSLYDVWPQMGGIMAHNYLMGFDQYTTGFEPGLSSLDLWNLGFEEYNAHQLWKEASNAAEAKEDYLAQYAAEIGYSNENDGKKNPVIVLDDPLSTGDYLATGLGLIGRFKIATTAYKIIKNIFTTDKISVPAGLPKNINWGRQELHIPGAKYTEGRSALDQGINPQELLDGVHSGKYPITRITPRGYPIVNFGKRIGTFGGKEASEYGIIHFGEKGAHIYPVNPIQY